VYYSSLSVVRWWTPAGMAAHCCCMYLPKRGCPKLQGVAASNARRNGQAVAYMPSHKSLVQGGHAHLVPLIEAAGGFLEVGVVGCCQSTTPGYLSSQVAAYTAACKA
jgi:hypothetical protein